MYDDRDCIPVIADAKFASLVRAVAKFYFLRHGWSITSTSFAMRRYI